ncbi:MAG: protein-glutamate O-methyltransferase CheR [Clostridiales bacterium]|nr:protein-glutamate O-methyltransferase CheR [Clostridiales bacterium]
MVLLQDDYVKLVGFVKSRYGINLENKYSLIENRLSNYIISRGFRSFSSFFAYVFADESRYEITNIINLLTTNYTYFMREVEHFKHLTETFLPYADNNITDNDLRIWSAGCSYGNEPYNIAMCIDEYFGFRKYGWDCKVLATDISINALQIAKDAVYNVEALEALSGKWIDKYFVKLTDKKYQVCDRIRNEVVFRFHNLMDPIKFKKQFDLILCRNVMIYFDTPTKDALSDRFYDATEDNGFLYIGHAETLSNNTKYERQQPAVYRKETVIPKIIIE